MFMSRNKEGYEKIIFQLIKDLLVSKKYGLISSSSHKVHEMFIKVF